MSATLINKLAEIMAAVERVPKRGKNTFHNYDYATEADIVAVVRQELASRHIMLIPAVQNHERHDLGLNKKGEPRDPVTILHMTFTFVDGDSGEREERPWLGAGQDVGDKGVYKAMTGAAKYFLLKTFLMPTGDDPEADKREARKAERDADRTSRQQQRAEAQPPASEGPAIITGTQQKDILKAAHENKWRDEEVKRLLASHGFTKSSAITVDKFPIILDALLNGAQVPVVA